MACELCEGCGRVSGYGAFPGGDPRHFSPDEEMCTPKEIDAHKVACASYDNPLEPAHQMTALEGGGYLHVARIMFGIGVYDIPCPECSAKGDGVNSCACCGTPMEEGCLCLLGSAKP